MANTLTNYTPKLLALGIKALREYAVMPRLVNRSYEALAAQPGAVINVPIPSAIDVRTPTAAVTWATNQDFAPTTVAVTLDFWREATVQLSDQDLKEVGEGVLPMQASEAIKALANAVDEYVLGKHTGIYNFAGAQSVAAFGSSLTALGSARMLLTRSVAPQGDRRLVIDPVAEQNLLLNSQILQFDTTGSREGIVEGSLGRKLGFDIFCDQNISTYTAGTGWASGFIASTVSGSVGDTTLNIINATASGSIKIGDVFTLTADTQDYCYVVNAVATASATVAVAISFTPALKTTVATGATLVVVSGTYTVNLAFHRDAFAFASRPLSDINGYGNSIMSVSDPVSGLALRLEVARQYKQTTFSYDVLCGANMVRPELACRIGGW